MALLVGTELLGLSDDALAMADEYMKIPMHGFTESFNISVSAALCLFHLSEKLRSSDLPWQLSEGDQVDILLDWTREVLKKSNLVEKKFLEELNLRK